jgi:hypothetical protein
MAWLLKGRTGFHDLIHHHLVITRMYIYFKIVLRIFLLIVLVVILIKRWSNYLKQKLLEEHNVDFQKNPWGQANLDELRVNYGSEKSPELRQKILRFIQVERLTYFFFGLGVAILVVLVGLFFAVLVSHSD